LLSHEDKIGQMLVFGWQTDASGSALKLNAHARALIEDLRVGGVILMARNIGPEPEAKALTESLQSLATSSKLPPLFVSSDQEGGRVARLGPPNYPAFPSAFAQGRSGDLAQAEHTASDIGQLLKRVGINWALMPVLDVNSNPNNPVIGDRSYGDTPAVVASMGVAVVQGMQDAAGVLACGKHFPGHGDTTVDSHLALTIIDKSFEDMETLELVPFKAAIDAGIGSIMTTHILFHALDREVPATLSPKILTRLLRKSLGFDGLIVTDCLEMKGVADTWGTPEAAVLAAIAGADMLLCCHTLETQVGIKNALLDAVKTGRLTVDRIDDANHRIAKAKQKWVQ
jgi:beta-N-acetylhexosaminidase